MIQKSNPIKVYFPGTTEHARELANLVMEILLPTGRLFHQSKYYSRVLPRENNDAEEVSQRICFNLCKDDYRRSRTYNQFLTSQSNIFNDRNLRNWIYSLIQNGTIDYYRQKKKHSLLSIDREDESEIPFSQNIKDEKSQNPLEELVKKQRASRVRQAIRELPAINMQAIIEFYFKPQKHREIADKLKIPIGTIKTRICFGLRKLQNIMGQSRYQSLRDAG